MQFIPLFKVCNMRVAIRHYALWAVALKDPRRVPGGVYQPDWCSGANYLQRLEKEALIFKQAFQGEHALIHIPGHVFFHFRNEKIDRNRQVTRIAPG